MKWVLCLVFLVFASCSLLQNLESVSAKIDSGMAKLEQGIAKYQKAKFEADTNKDGKTDANEWIWWLLGATGLGGVAKLLQRNMKSDERKTKLEARLDALESTTE